MRGDACAAGNDHPPVGEQCTAGAEVGVVDEPLAKGDGIGLVGHRMLSDEGEDRWERRVTWRRVDPRKTHGAVECKSFAQTNEQNPPIGKQSAVHRREGRSV